ETSFLDDEVTLTRVTSEIDGNGAAVTHLALDVDQRELYLVTDDGAVSLYDVRDKENVRFVDRAPAVAEGATVTALEFLSGGISVLIGDDRGGLAQWFPVRDDNNVYTLARVRDFPPMSAAVVHIAPEYFRKAFAALDADGQLALFHTTAGRRILLHETGADEVSAFAMAPRANAAIVAGADGEFSSFRIDNEHPEVSFQALWQEVWYENRQEPEYIWQSSSASSDFEPKFSLTPLTFGTLKATFYSMLFAVPLAVLGAVYTAYFMTPFMRAVVKPSVEVMAALPTVILGFLAGLWLAPLVERELLGLILGVAVVPLGILLACWLYTRLPRRWRELVPDGWEALMLIPVIIVMTWVSLSAGSLAEVWFFGGSLPQWLTQNYGITYDQRNSLVVGIAIGFAVIPTIFSISEDAVFSVPRSLTMGSLALGATPWQTAVRVILLTASPGIFSAVMIGMGRAVGETMIVLMATGNTPIMDLNIFQGFRALSANIAVEMPESEVDSTHYRILFLAALVLFMVTFLVNTLAELVRQRLRRKYASL
ncbi:MAG: ABC transporter permease subunit, partial [Gammaproteobacteria bacterium]